MPSSASARVFGTPEVMEYILIHFDAKELAVLQQVCRQFYNVMQGSDKLRQTLFLSPVQINSWISAVKRTTDLNLRRMILRPDEDDGYDIGPKLPQCVNFDEQLEPWFNFTRIRDSTAATENDSMIVLLNPVFDPVDWATPYSTKPEVNFEFRVKRMLSWCSTSMGWEQMFVTQPPVQELELSFPIRSMSSYASRHLDRECDGYSVRWDDADPKTTHIYARDTDGVKIGTIAEHIRHEVESGKNNGEAIRNAASRIRIPNCVGERSVWVRLAEAEDERRATQRRVLTDLEDVHRRALSI